MASSTRSLCGMRNTSSNCSSRKKRCDRLFQRRVAAYSWQLSNVRSALEWSFGSHGNAEIAKKLAVSSTRLFMELALLIEWRPWAERALARLEDQHKRQDLAREFLLLDGLFLYSSWTTDIH
jgi:hypothetical protein